MRADLPGYGAAWRHLLAALMLCLAVAAGAQYEIGERALARGDYVEAWLTLKPLAESGDPRAQQGLGIMYALGLGVDPSMPDAAHWLTLAAAQGNAVAQARLGWMYYNGIGVELDRSQAYGYSRAAAEAGDPWGQCNLGYSLLEGDGVARNATAAAGWFRRSAMQGYAPCQLNLGLIYEQGNGLDRDPVQAYAWYGVAAVAGDPQAIALRDKLAGQLSPEALERGRSVARELSRKIQDSTASGQ